MTGRAIILAADLPHRMGRDPAQLPWMDGLPVVAYQVETLADAGWSPIVVSGPRNVYSLISMLGAARVALNLRPEAGLAGSIRCGLAHWQAGGTPLLISAVDQPREAPLYTRLLEAAVQGPDSIYAPANGESHGHPVVFGADARVWLESVNDENGGLSGLLDAATDRLQLLEVDHEPWNLSTQEAYEAAWQKLKQLEETDEE